ncbi:MAG: lipopolysaccharide transport periplasmic protein LptA [Sideroxyarcus sp.]|nr:lipopolysaccharide transport periplasmic protein LptA [Sideroxyarcus sp.]
MSRYTSKHFISALLLLSAAAGAQAELADREQPTHLEADHVLIDEARQFSQFEGRVQVRQGSLLIRADKVEVREDAEGYLHLTAFGKPASFRQRYEGTQEYAEGYGERIEYDMRADTVDLFDQARLKRGADEVRGARITYSTKTEVFEARGDAATPDQEAGRVRAVLQPKHDPAPGEPAATPLLIQPSESLSPPSSAKP